MFVVVAEVDQEVLYGKIQEVLRLEEALSQKPERIADDPDYIKYHALIDSIPVLAPQDLIDYHKHLVCIVRESSVAEIKIGHEGELGHAQRDFMDDIEKRIRDSNETLYEKLKEATFETLRRICTPQSYSRIYDQLRREVFRS